MKQKRRQKAAAQQAGTAIQPPSKQPARPQEPESTLSLPEPPPVDAEYDDGLHYDDNGDDQYYSDQGNAQYYADEHGVNGMYADDHLPQANGARKKTKKKRKNKGGTLDYPYDNMASGYPPPVAQGLPRPPPPPPPMQSHNPQDRIWNTSTQEERERIREFWLQLGEEQRKSLVKIEKEAVLKKMKEQQKHSCSCTVCGRKRTAIEEELEVLYDAYYEELEQYASHNLQHRWAADDQFPVPGLLHDSAFMRGSLSQQVNRIDPNRVLPPHEATRPRIRELADGESEDLDEDDLDEDEFSDEYEDEEEEFSDEYDDDYAAPGPAQDLFNFGQHLTVKGGILTVADDLLKNDGKKFIEMMEQLAERRMQREEQMQYEQQSHLQHSYNDHNHGPAPEDDEYDEEDDEDYDSQDDFEDEEEEMDHLTEEQRMNEGRRMFQIFAARMFEQRVLTAYREKVSDERSKQLVRELEEEEKRKEEQAQKKARDAAKKKEKKKAQQQAKAEEKAKKDAELQAAEAAKKAEDEKKAEEQRRKKEELRLKKEAEKKALEEERQRKEQEKQKRQQAERERQQEAERKAREQKAAEKKAREEQKKKEREERESREREAREQKAHEEKQRAVKETRTRETSDAADRARRDENSKTTTQRPTLAKVPSSAQVALPPSLYKQASHSPQVAVATPAIPKAPTPVRPRQASRQGSHGSSPKGIAGKSTSPNQPTQPQQMQVKQILQKPHGQPQSASHQPQPLQQPHPVMPPPGIGSMPANGPFGQPSGFNGFPHSQAPGMASMTQRAPMGQNMHIFPPQGHQVGGQFGRFPHMNGIPPGMNGTVMPPIGRGNFSPDAPPGFQGPPPPQQQQQQQPQQQQALQQQPIGTPQVTAPGAPFVGASRESIPSHSRQQSGSDKPFEPTPIGPPQSRPAPIHRPSSVKPQDDAEDSSAELDDLTKHLGSKVLLDDADDEPELPNPEAVRRASAQAPGMPRANTFGTPAFGAPRPELFGGSTWGTPSLNAFGGPPGLPTQNTWGPQSPGQGWPQSPFGTIGGGAQSRNVSGNVARPHIVRRLICDACKHLNSLAPTPDGFHDVAVVTQRVEQTRNLNEGPVREAEIVSVCEANRVGSVMNGGGTLSVKREPTRTLVKYEDASPAIGGLQGLGLGGEIGSPLQGASVPFGGLGGGSSARPFPGLANSHSNLGF